MSFFLYLSDVLFTYLTFSLPTCHFPFTSLSFSLYLPDVFLLPTCRFPSTYLSFFFYLPVVFPLPACRFPSTYLSCSPLPTCHVPLYLSFPLYLPVVFPLPTCRFFFTSLSFSLYLPDVKIYYYLLSSPCTPLSSKVHAPLLKKEKIKTGKRNQIHRQLK